jgi:hypothetical protein
LNLARDPALDKLPSGIQCDRLNVSGTRLEWLPPDLQVRERIDATNCARLRYLPALKVTELELRGCRALTSLPDGLDAERLNISDCPQLTGIPIGLGRRLTHLIARNCTGLATLPEEMTGLSVLDVSGCGSLETLPGDLQARRIDVAGTRLTSLPGSLRSTQIFWNGVWVNYDIAFHPESIRVRDIFREENIERRRVMRERIGNERFVRESAARVIDRDEDRGGERRLLRIRMDGEEDFVCVDVQCPSTGHRYILRVPPDMRTCRQAIAWTAGFVAPDLYRPVVET